MSQTCPRNSWYLYSARSPTTLSIRMYMYGNKLYVDFYIITYYIVSYVLLFLSRCIFLSHKASPSETSSPPHPPLDSIFAT